MGDAPATLLDAVRYFSDPDRCEDYLRRLRWPGGKPRCPACGSTNIGEIKTRRLLRCKDCRRQIYAKRGTIFEDSPLGLDKWFVAVWAIANCKNGISSHALARAIGVQQKTAWFMLHRIRTAMEVDDEGTFSGPTEADTTCAGGRLTDRAPTGKDGAGFMGIQAFQALLNRVVSVQKEAVEAKMEQKHELKKLEQSMARMDAMPEDEVDPQEYGRTLRRIVLLRKRISPSNPQKK